MNYFIELCRLRNLKVPLSENMLDYYLLLGYKCFTVSKSKNIGLININNKYNFHLKCLDMEDIKYILKVSNKSVSIDFINQYLNKKYELY